MLGFIFTFFPPKFKTGKRRVFFPTRQIIYVSLKKENIFGRILLISFELNQFEKRCSLYYIGIRRWEFHVLKLKSQGYIKDRNVFFGKSISTNYCYRIGRAFSKLKKGPPCFGLSYHDNFQK